MSLTGFKSTNHPQQVDANGAADDKDDRWTPQALFDKWNAEYGPFTVDVAAAPHNAKAARYYTKDADGLAQSWAGETVWCNPPYSNVPGWVEKAHNEVRSGCRRVVMLLPANRTEQKFWHKYIEPYRDKPCSNVRVVFIEKRINFGAVAKPDGKWNSSPPFGCCLVIFEGV